MTKRRLALLSTDPAIAGLLGSLLAERDIDVFTPEDFNASEQDSDSAKDDVIVLGTGDHYGALLVSHFAVCEQGFDIIDFVHGCWSDDDHWIFVSGLQRDTIAQRRVSLSMRATLRRFLHGPAVKRMPAQASHRSKGSVRFG